MSTDLHSLLGPYALDALDHADLVRFEAHLDECVPCVTELPGFREVTVRLAGSATRQPPATLRASVIHGAGHTPQRRRSRWRRLSAGR